MDTAKHAMKFGGVVLCGGRSSRMGRPKAWLPFGGELLLPRVVRTVRSVVEPVVVVAAPGQDVPALPAGVEIVRDPVEGRGPLAGLAAGLAALEGRVDAVYLSACDAPFLSPAFVRFVIDSLGKQSIVVPRIGGYFHPLAAAYRSDVSEAVASLLAADRLRPVDLFDLVPTRVLVETDFRAVDPGLQSLRNVNTPDEYARALRDLSQRPD